MSASQIPNLLSLSGRGRGRGRGRSRGRGRGPGSEADEEETPEQAKERADRIVQLTDMDANLSRLSAVDAGYLQDPYARSFTPNPELSRRMPIINRGTYARTQAIDLLVTTFLQATTGKKQIVSLGAGTDTRYFRLAAAKLTEELQYHEIDFPENTVGKLAGIRRNSSLSPMVTEMGQADGTSLHTKNYHLHPFDLRRLVDSHAKVPFLSVESGGIGEIDPHAPTLIISECCLCYLTVDQVNAIFQRLVFSSDNKEGHLKSAIGVIFYEPIRPDDAFGRVMTYNLEKRGIQMPTLAQYPTLNSQKERFSSYGLIDGARAVDVEFVMTHWVEAKERMRVDRCEMLDEMEEWILLAQHYCISYGWRSGQGSPANVSRIDDVWSGWARLPVQAS